MCVGKVSSGTQGKPAFDRGQASLIGVVLLVAITLIGVTAVVAFGSSALDVARTQSQTASVEHALTQLDSRAAMVALGETDVQSVTLPSASSGRYEVRPTEGWVNISHRNYSTNSTVRVQTIANLTLGSIVYDDGETLIGYQAGGVWHHAGDGTVMVSPPELHYQGSTLTFPVITVAGEGSVAGSATANLQSLDVPSQRFPNETRSYDYGGSTFVNPVEQGNVTITVRSQFYKGWATYFQTRTAGLVEVFDGNQTVRVTLVSARTLGDFSMPAEGNAIQLRGVGDEHPITAFTLDLQIDSFKNLHWSFHAEEGNRKFEFHVHSPPGTKCDDGSLSNNLDVSLFYFNGTGGSHEWQNQSVPTGPGTGFSVDCSSDTLTVDLGSSTPLTLGDIDLTGRNNKWYYGSDIDSEPVSSPLVFDQHPTVEYTNNGTGDTESIGFLVNHYFSQMAPSIDLTVSDGPGGSSRVDEGESSGTLEYHTIRGRGFLTFLHVSENRLAVEVD